jgi:integrase/recombinase XerC/integrase/recombinase XerD
MGTVHQLSTGREAVTLGEAAAAYLATLDHPESAGTRRVYGGTCRALLAALGRETALTAVTPAALGEWFTARWGAATPATWDTNRGALRSLFSYCQAQGWIASATDLIGAVERRKRAPDRSRALSRSDVAALLDRDDISLRERTLWRLLYESAARSAEVLALDVADLDMVNRRARVRRKGGAVDVITWRTGAARLLPRLLKGRKAGPVFLTERKARVALPPADLDPETGRARLSYTQAAGIFTAATKGCHGGPWTLHQLRHSALTHAAEDGASTATLLAFSGHTSVASLSRYARVSPDALARWQAGRDPARRR